MTTTDQELLRRMDDAEHMLTQHNNRISNLETGGPTPMPPRPQRNMDLFLGGFHDASEIDLAHQAGWRQGYGMDAVSSITKAWSFMQKANDLGAKVHLIVANLSPQDITGLIQHPTFHDTVAYVEVEPTHIGPGNRFTWNDVSWSAFRDQMLLHGYGDRWYANKLTYDQTPYHIPESVSWTNRSRNMYPLNGEDKYFPNKPNTDHYEVISNAGMWEMGKWILDAPGNQAQLVVQVGRQPFTSQFHSALPSNRRYVAPNRDQIHYWLLQGHYYGLSSMMFYSARMKMSNGVTDYIWDYERSQLLTTNQVTEFRQGWHDLLEIVDAWSSGTPPLIRPRPGSDTLIRAI